MIAKDLLAAALELPEEEREMLADQLLESLDGGSQMSPRVRGAWVSEVNSRLAAYRAGRSEPVLAREAVDQIRARISRVHES